MNQITIYNRESKKLETELVFGQNAIDFFYGTKIGVLLTNILLKRKLISKIYGYLQKHPSTKKKISPFIERYQINIAEISEPLESFKSFNDFFTRKLKPEARPINMNRSKLISPADCRLMYHKISEETVIPIKGLKFTLTELVNNKIDISDFINGTCLVFRLAPVDYHRFCYIDDGDHAKIERSGSYFHSVNPIALKNSLPIFQKNYREICVLNTENFGKVIHIDVGAMMVGKIIQHHKNGGVFKKGEEKGLFEFGASTIIQFFQPDTVEISEEIVNYSNKGIETLVKFGSVIGEKI